MGVRRLLPPLAVILALVAPLRAQGAESILVEAQALRRQGRMEAASRALDGLGEALTEHQRGRVFLVRGNIAFEQLAYGLAASLYEQSEASFARARLTDEESGAAGVSVAIENRGRARVEGDRRRALAGRARLVQAAALSLFLLGLASVGFMAWRSVEQVNRRGA